MIMQEAGMWLASEGEDLDHALLVWICVDGTV